MNLPDNLQYADPYLHFANKLPPYLLTSKLQLPSSRKLSDMHFSLFNYHFIQNHVALEAAYVLRHIHQEVKGREIEKQVYSIFSNKSISLSYKPISFNTASNSPISPNKDTIITAPFKPESPPLPTSQTTTDSISTSKLQPQLQIQPLVEDSKEVDPYERLYLNLPFAQKDFGKSLGAKFDWDLKKWYILRIQMDTMPNVAQGLSPYLVVRK